MSHVFRPSAIIEIGGRARTAAEAGLKRAAVSLALGRHGRAELALWPGSAFADAAIGDSVALALGPAGDETPVLTGTISERRREAEAIVLEALDIGGTLSRLRKTITFEETAIDRIVARIAEEASMQADSDAPDTLAIYYVRPERPLWEHLRELAALAGRDLTVDGDGVLLFRRPGSGGTRSIRHGAELIAWSLAERETPGPVARAALGAASESGKWHWINPDPLGEAPPPARVAGVITNRDLAEAASEAAATRAARAALGGWLRVTGDAAIRPADTALVTGLPGGDPEPLRIVAVRHGLDGTSGFTTHLEVEGGGAGASLAGGLAGSLAGALA